MEHTLKCLEPYFEAIVRGDKTFEVRRDDRGFQCGDVLILQKHDGVRFVDYVSVRRRVLYVLTGGQFGIESGYVVMALGQEL